MHHPKKVRQTNAFGLYVSSPPSPAFAFQARTLALEAQESINRMERAREAALKALRGRLDRGELSGAEERRRAEQINKATADAQRSAKLHLAALLDEAQRLDEDASAGRHA
ncbi:hypothetical protein ACWFNS_04735 [Oerskovia enterophila]